MLGILILDTAFPRIPGARGSPDTFAFAVRHAVVDEIVLECANMPPYRAVLAEATGLPVFDAANLVAWFHAALKRRPDYRCGWPWLVIE